MEDLFNNCLQDMIISLQKQTKIVLMPVVGKLALFRRHILSQPVLILSVMLCSFSEAKLLLRGIAHAMTRFLIGIL